MRPIDVLTGFGLAAIYSLLAMLALLGCMAIVPCDTDMDCQEKNPHIDY
jgi:hypothetical protein